MAAAVRCHEGPVFRLQRDFVFFETGHINKSQKQCEQKASILAAHFRLSSIGHAYRSTGKTLVLSALGGALEFYDFVIFVFFASVIGKLFFPPDMPDWLMQLETFGIFGAGYLARPLGGIIMAHFGDRTGRKRMFMLSVFLMAIPTFLIGCIPVYAQIGYAAPIFLLAMRIMQGAAIGGEAPGAWVFVSEHVAESRIGFACGLLAAGLVAGILLGSLTSTAINIIYTPIEISKFAWRIPFLLGGVFGVIAVYLRRWLQETPVFEEMLARRSLEQRLPLKVVLQSHLWTVLISMALTWMLTGIVVVVILMAPTLMQKLYGIPALQTLYGNDLAALGFGASVIVTGSLIDRFGMLKVALVLCPVMVAAAYALFSATSVNAAYFVPFYVVAGLAAGVIALVPVAMVKGFPSAIRFTGVSFSYNVAYAVAGGVTPVIVQAWALRDKLGPAHYVAACTAIGLFAAILNCQHERANMGVWKEREHD